MPGRELPFAAVSRFKEPPWADTLPGTLAQLSRRRPLSLGQLTRGAPGSHGGRTERFGAARPAAAAAAGAPRRSLQPGRGQSGRVLRAGGQLLRLLGGLLQASEQPEVRGAPPSALHSDPYSNYTEQFSSV